MVNRIGQQAGNYRLIRLLGQGGFADVYLGEHIHLNTQAAIKVLNTQLTSEGTEQFRKEARIIAHLEHPHIVRVLEFGLEQGFPFLVMTYASNGSLRQRHPKRTQLTLFAIVSYVKQVADALQYAHDSRLIHRDVKPENMLLGGRNEVLLSDFGIAVEAHNTLSQTLQEIAGTIPYMAPEQIQGKPCPASDQYALGIVVYEWISGVRPFNGSPVEIAIQQQSTPPPSLRERVPTLSLTVEQVVLKALAKDPRQRFTNAQEFARILEQSCQPVEPIHLTLSSNTQPSLPSALTVNVLPPTRTLPPLGTTFLTYRGHAAAVSAAVWSPDGTCIASASGSRIHIWHADHGDNLFIFKHLDINAVSVAWSPDGRYVALGWFEDYLISRNGKGDKRVGNVQIWSVETGKSHNIFRSLFTRQKHLYFRYSNDYLGTLAWSPDARYIASTDVSQANIWNVIAKEPANCLSFDSYWYSFADVKDIEWSPSGIRIATAGKSVDIWEPATGRHVSQYARNALAVAWSRDSSHIACAMQDGTVEIRHVVSEDTVLMYREHTDRVNDVAWSPDGTRIASASHDGTVHIWDAVSGDNFFTYRNHLGTVNALSWSPDGTRIASGSWDSTVQIWQAT